MLFQLSHLMSRKGCLQNKYLPQFVQIVKHLPFLNNGITFVSLVKERD